ncbi:hypothetical protein D4R99_03205 [bacterium]|nr:MAG: hypothetical protein D4R99_03205 [bacterium]
MTDGKRWESVVERSYNVETDKLLKTIVEECRECLRFRVTEYQEWVTVWIEANYAMDITYTISAEIYGKIKKKIEIILKNKKKGN